MGLMRRAGTGQGNAGLPGPAAWRYGGMQMHRSILQNVMGAALVCLALGACVSKPIRTTVNIDAPPATVWAILVDFERYPEWNPYHISLRGEAYEGATLQLRILRPDGKVVEIDPTIKRLDPETEFTWGEGVWGVFKGRHAFLLEDNGRGGTRLYQLEDFDGLGVLFADLPRGVLTEGYHKVNVALKERAEAFAVGCGVGAPVDRRAPTIYR